MPFSITTTREFAAAHALRLYDGSLEPLHGHNWRVEVTVSASQLDPIGVVMDFHELERLVDSVIKPWHNRHLNEVSPFFRAGEMVINTSTENVAMQIGKGMSDGLPSGVRLERVDVWETATNRASYFPQVA